MGLDVLAIEIVSIFSNMESEVVCCQPYYVFVYGDLKPSTFGDLTILVKKPLSQYYSYRSHFEIKSFLGFLRLFFYGWIRLLFFPYMLYISSLVL